jgi:predicted DNA-binding protein (MmcQ/YjbR family)
MTAKADWHPCYRALYEHCRAKPGAWEDHPWGDTVFKLGDKVFAFLASPNHPGVTVKPPADEREALLELPYVRKASYIGRYGWVHLSVGDDEALRLALELIDDTYDQVAVKAKRKRDAGGTG